MCMKNLIERHIRREIIGKLVQVMWQTYIHYLHRLRRIHTYSCIHILHMHEYACTVCLSQQGWDLYIDGGLTKRTTTCTAA